MAASWLYSCYFLIAVIFVYLWKKSQFDIFLFILPERKTFYLIWEGELLFFRVKQDVEVWECKN
jgi:hypothetical protein